MKSKLLHFFCCGAALTVCALTFLTSCREHGKLKESTNVYGVVTCDGHGVEGVWVSDGEVFSCTDKEGRYELTSSKRGGTVHVSVPSGYTAPVAEGSLVPSFFRELSSDSTVVECHDFTLLRQNQDHYSAVFLPDVHLCNDEPRKHDLKYFQTVLMPSYSELYAELSARGPVLTVDLGDISHDRYWYSNDFNLQDVYDFVCRSGICAPLLGVTGNHDHDPALVCEPREGGDFQSQGIYRRIFGPDRYSMDIGSDHWVFVDNIQYLNTAVEASPYKGVAGKRDYKVGLTSAQKKWLEQDLSHIPEGKHVVMCAHAPIVNHGTGDDSYDDIAFVDSLMRSHGSMLDFYAGHIHRMEISAFPQFPSVRVYALSAASGNMWECYPDNQVVGLDGSEGSLHYVCDGAVTASHSYNGQNAYFRIYDMNSLVRSWKSDSDRKWIMDQVRSQVDFTSARYRDMLVVNFWWDAPGSRLEILEDGMPLKVEPAPFAVDPEALYQSFNFRRATYEGKDMDLNERELAFAKLYCARCRKPHSQILVRAFSPDGSLLSEQTLER